MTMFDEIYEAIVKAGGEGTIEVPLSRKFEFYRDPLAQGVLDPFDPPPATLYGLPFRFVERAEITVV